MRYVYMLLYDNAKKCDVCNAEEGDAVRSRGKRVQNTKNKD